ncbi:MAG: AMP-binding protein [Tidjanibacter sp.]|nr:AMP-binding protein [Tidjanibacter sp.]
MKKTLVDLFEGSVANYPNNTFLKEKIGKEWTDTTYAQVRDKVYELGAGFVKMGVAPKDNMALLSEGRNMWIISELAMFYAGAANVPLSIKLEESNDLMFRLKHSDTKWIVVSKGQLPKIRRIIADLPLVEKVVVLDPIDEYQDKEVSLESVLALGRELLAEDKEGFLKIGQAIQNDDLATITYTSGTTADPKGVCLSHRNYTANVEQALTLMDIDHTWRTLIILPLDHCFAHVVGFYIFMHKGAQVATVQNGRTGMETLKNIPINIREIKPHIILSVPTLAKNFKKNIESSIRAKGKTVEKLYNWGLKNAIAYNGNSDKERGKGLRALRKPLVWLFDKVIFSKVREGFGGELRFFVGGGALLDKELQTFFMAVGMPMFQGYGLSEATPVISSNGPRRYEFGSSGVMVKPFEMKICDADGNELPEGEKGEMVCKGENVMMGYWKNEKSTADTVKDGWLYTGDMGAVKNGLLYVYGRFKSLLIAADGEKYCPEGIEEAYVSTSKFIDHAILHNNQDPYTTLLISPNKEAMKAALAPLKLTLDSEEGQRKIVELVQADLNEYKRGGKYAGQFPERWLPATFALLNEPFTEQNHLINSTMKVVRGKVEEYFADRLNAMYTPEGKDIYYNVGKF